jgi:4-hydroxythreonine-4-phosphate dehydrogenase
MFSASPSLAPLAVSMGEPAGIGTEIALKAWSRLRGTGPAFFLLHDPDEVAETASRIGLDLPLRTIAAPAEVSSVFADALPVMPIKLPRPVTPGVIDTGNSGAVIQAIQGGVAYAESGEAAALVTNPIQKSALYAAGFPFPGHTEYLEHLAGEPHRAIMTLACEGLRVVPVTIHESLKSAIGNLSRDRIVEIALGTAAALRRDFGVESPRLAVAGLNPHAGEDGTMGREEIDFIAPAAELLRARGIDVIGPLPPDTMFTARSRSKYDAAICMYHDQALIPLKTLDVDGGVNVTLGLPFVRTSPDHGTALDLAGKGIADPGSLIAALRMAAEIAAHRKDMRTAA